MFFILNKEQLTKALTALERAEKHGFTHSLACFKVDSLTKDKHIALEYDSMWDKAHPTDGNLDWGRQKVSENYKLINGKLREV